MFIRSFVKTLLYITSICFVKSGTKAIKLLKLGSGTNFPGKVARKISPGILSYLASQTKKEVITITGTNGKTTTAGLVASIFERQKRKIVHNRKGANMLTGVTAAVVAKSSLQGNLDADNCVFEMDEAYLTPAFDEFNPEIVMVTNLFRDQLDRYGELNTTAKKIESAVEKTSKVKPLKLILNADDPLVSGITGESDGSGITRVFYGLEDIKFSDIDVNSKETSSYSPQETVNCRCKKPFNYAKIFYGHLGHYECACGVKRPETRVSGRAFIDVEYSDVLIKTANDTEFKVRVNLPGLYNCYNALAAATVALEAGISAENIKKGIENYSTTFGRSEALTLRGKEVLIQLIKNPIGATEVLKTIKNDEKGKLFILINDNYADGRDVSWLWDADFELLSNYNKTAIISGIRAADMAVRLKYAGIDNKKIIVTENIRKAFLQALENVETSEKLYVLPTYTALLELDRIKQTL